MYKIQPKVHSDMTFQKDILLHIEHSIFSRGKTTDANDTLCIKSNKEVQ